MIEAVLRWLPPSGPGRRLLLLGVLTNVANGLWLGSFALYLTRDVGLSPTEFGVGALVAGLGGAACATPLAALADRVGLRRSLAWMQLWTAAATLSFVFVHDPVSYILAASLLGASYASSVATRVALTAGIARAGLAGADTSILLLAKYRVMSQIGLALGGVAAGVVIQVDTSGAYVSMVTLTAGVYAGAAALVRTLPDYRSNAPARVDRRATSAIRNVRYVVVVAGLTLLTLNWAMLSVGIPLWITHHTDAPRWVAAAVLILNAVAIAVLQVPMSRGTGTIAAGRRAALRSGVLLLGATAVLSTTQGGAGAPVVTAILVAGVIHLFGELYFVSASWALTLGLAPEHAHGEYQGLNAAGTALAEAAGPIVMTSLVVGLAAPGWLVLGALFVLAGVVLHYATGDAAPPVTANAATAISQ